MDELYALAVRVGEALLARGQMLVTAESCTGGWIGQAVTAVAGSSQWYERGFITYTNEAKREMLGVKAETLTRHGAVSKQTVCEMASGALERSYAHVSVAVSGIAGPAGGSVDKPVGTVWIAWATHGSPPNARQFYFAGERAAVRHAAVLGALEGVLETLSERK